MTSILTAALALSVLLHAKGFWRWVRRPPKEEMCPWRCGFHLGDTILFKDGTSLPISEDCPLCERRVRVCQSVHGYFLRWERVA